MFLKGNPIVVLKVNLTLRLLKSLALVLVQSDNCYNIIYVTEWKN